MKPTVELEQALRSHFEARADGTVLDGQLDAVLDRAARHRQRPQWLVALRSPSMSTLASPAIRVQPRTAWLLLAAGVLLTLLLGVAVAGRHGPPAPPFNGLIAFARYVGAQGESIPYTIWPDGSHLHQVQAEAAANPFWSPDGRWLSMTDRVVHPDGTAAHDLHIDTSRMSVGCVDWSPDGKRFLCQGSNDDDPSVRGLYTIRAEDGGDLVRLTTAAAGTDDVPFAYSPDGSTIVFARIAVGEPRGQLYLVGADGTDLRQLGSIPSGAADWMPDGQSLLVASNYRLYRMDALTGATTPVVQPADPEALMVNPHVSPDGTRILFISQVDDQKDLYQMKLDGTDVIHLTTDPANEYFTDWGVHPLDG